MSLPSRSLLLLFACLTASALACSQARPMLDPSKEASTTSSTQEKPAKQTKVYPPATGQLYALLVGCTRYDNLVKTFWLEGPGNDVPLMRRLLLDWPGFKKKEIVCLSEKDAEQKKDKRLRPTRENIKREFAQLSKKAKVGDQVVILMAGHGSQQPDQPPYDETDGLDEIFLPADVGKWDGSKKAITNAIVDDELEVWLKAITDTKASVWITIDACHSGTMTRDYSVEVMREILPTDLGVPEKEIAAAQNRASEEAKKAGNEVKRGNDSTSKPTPFEVPARGDLVAMYACRSNEPTMETLLPYTGADRKRHGLFTFTLCQILKQATTPLTYKELVQQVQDQYDAWGRVAPAPLVEGPDADREVLGSREWAKRSEILLGRDPDDDSLMIRAGALQGLTENTILAVYPLAGSKDADKLLGHVKITQLNTLDAKVTPCEYAGEPAPKKLEPRGRCRVVEIDYGSRRLKLAIAPLTAEKEKTLGKGLTVLARKRPGLVEVVNDRARADWLVSLNEGKVYLTSTMLVAANVKDRNASRFVEPAGDDEQLRVALEKLCTTIARANTLLAMASFSESERRHSTPPADVALEMIAYKSRRGGEGTVVDWKSGGRTVPPGFVAFRVSNRSRFAVDVTLLFIDPNYGIHAIFPAKKGAVEDNRLLPKGKPFTTPRFKLSGNPPGRDHLVLIAVKAEGQPLDFKGFAQPSLAQAKLYSSTARTFDSALGRFLEGAFYKGQLRGTLTADTVDNAAVRLLSWETKR